ncbi:hypothetical protein CH306_22910 [Rhodococcus sp. 15-725-2-2b]|nr:hypothetical protein CH277_04345 [Rhodococcus sp. 06-469-3-2]OZD42732.1 hypothetical protein CH264_21760 [Rhodococcus sp. 06-1477-1A]OZE06345.1 hypothetical protein CH249_23025 [Rhodococcus sp. 05-2255-3B1]OZE09389.1 hypothetical protein CH250_16300 [Rhodococcus sp. 05-2255-3C]OZE18497.1 hypothetical protein CH255_16295 [Rhodococcus sp. 05-2255-2A2]OZE68531.1 hypothetical protein CH306_22910 [Rhodococcus sp. 15-725-2-2b]
MGPRLVARGAVVAVVASAAAFGGVASGAPIETETYCGPIDPGLAELSGLTSIDGVLYVIGDSGADDRVAELDANCAVTRWIDVPVDPYDVEDLTSYDGSLWLADIGDNRMRRDTVALTRMDPASGGGELYRLTYPDGAHDAETILIEPGGRPVIVTKDLSGVSGVYVPAADQSVADLSSPGPTPMRKVGNLAFTATDTVGGPPFVVGSILATGGAVSADGAVAAVRTYTDAYLFRVPDGDIASALVDPTAPRAVVALPDQPQGEASVFTDDGSLLIASEAGFGSAEATLPPILRVPDAVDLEMSAPEPVAVEPVSPTVVPEQSAQTPTATDSEWTFRAAVAAGVVLIAGAVGFTVRRSMRSR